MLCFVNIENKINLSFHKQVKLRIGVLETGPAKLAANI